MRRTLEQQAAAAKEKSDRLAARVAKRRLRESSGYMKRLHAAQRACNLLLKHPDVGGELRGHLEYSVAFLESHSEKIVSEAAEAQ